MWKLSVILLISASFLHMIDAGDQQTNEYDQGLKTTGKKENNCSENQHWEECGTRCPARCNVVGRIGIRCPGGCRRGCFCNDGYAFKSGTSGPCVRHDHCPRINPVPTPKPTENKCPKNQHWTDCGTACPKSCENEKQSPTACIALCVSGCFCNEGYIRSGTSDSCVLPQDCPKPPAPQCPKNQHWDDKATVCQHNCQNKDVKFKCTNATMAGCFCDEGFVFEFGTSGHCVRREDCPKPALKCPKNQHWDDKATVCQHNCQNKDVMFKCTNATMSGCFCDEGFVFEFGTSGHCVRPEDCPKPEPKCPKNQHWDDKATVCQHNCQNKDAVFKCTNATMSGCFCNKGYIFEFGTSGHCVRPEDCPKPQEHKCPKNQEWKERGPTCPARCNTVGRMFFMFFMCPNTCKPGCFSKEPSIFNPGTSIRCVHREDCRKNNPIPSPKPTVHSCPKDQVWSDCGTACPNNCENVGNKARICPRYCKGACVCQEPLVFRSGSDGPCVPPQHCPKINPVQSPKPTENNCSENQEWSPCGAACPNNCENVGNKARICPQYCKGACVCSKPLVFRSGSDGRCVLPEDCPKVDPVPSPRQKEKKCPKNQHWEDEGTLCPHNCQNNGAIIRCKAGSRQGCFCNEGYVFLSGDSDHCVLPKDCPPKSLYGSSEEHSAE